jgi:lysozyme
MNLRQQLIDFEGYEHEAYPDPISADGKPFTIGVGHTGPEVHEGLRWTDAQIDAALDVDMAEAIEAAAKTFPWFHALNEPRQAVLVGMIFQMGLAGTLKFVRTLDDMRDERWANAAEGMRQSKWAKQTPMRVRLLAIQMETGTWA